MDPVGSAAAGTEAPTRPGRRRRTDAAKRARLGGMLGLVVGWLVVLTAPSCSSDDETVPPPAPGEGGSGDAGLDGTGAVDAADAPAGEPIVLLPKAAIAAEELAVLVNANDPQSVEVAAYYQQARQIPADHVVTLSFDTGAVLSTDAFALVKAEVDAAVGPDIQAFAITWTQPYRVGCMSVTSAFALGFDDKYCNTTGGACGLTAWVEYFDSDSVRPFTDHGLRPAMSLAAATTADALALIDRGVASDRTFPMGDGTFVRTTDQARSVRWPAFVETVADWDYDGGLALTYLDNSSGSGLNYLENTADVLFYFTGLATVPAIETNTYLPGAVADHLTSFGGQVPTSGQMSVVRWLEAGATASYGTVVEPCAFTIKFPNTRVLLPHYFRGETVLEAYWKSVRAPGEGLFVGEPLARPWGQSFVDWEDGTLTIQTTMLVPGRAYELGAADTEQGPFTVVLGDIMIARHQLATIVLEDAFAPTYRLAAAGTR